MDVRCNEREDFQWTTRSVRMYFAFNCMPKIGGPQFFWVRLLPFLILSLLNFMYEVRLLWLHWNLIKLILELVEDFFNFLFGILSWMQLSKRERVFAMWSIIY